ALRLSYDLIKTGVFIINYLINKVNGMKKFINTLKKYLSIKNMILASFMMLPIVATAADLFVGGKGTIKDTFGSGSTVNYILLLLEVLAGVFLYIKTKNLAMLGGIAVVVVFLNVAFGILG
ncbi:type IV conjugative transfer system pilin TraA, partial [Testudinibacter sp. TR-2022]|uniref:type IV conjugative transfer system pilin TraA n=2 Tax=Testudinibacter sp. TR-2022 TaxID=2585029 RepID=UPI002279B77C